MMTNTPHIPPAAYPFRERPRPVTYNSWDSIDQRVASPVKITSDPTRRGSAQRELDMIEMRDNIRILHQARERDLESQVRITTQQYRMGWRSVLQIFAAFVSTCTLAIATSNLADRISREGRNLPPN